jgi:hypothetical protein
LLACSLPALGHAGTPADLDALASACDAQIAFLERRVQLLALAANLLILVGAALSALGGALAGFSRRGKLRSGGALLAIFGALLCLLSTILPDRAKIETRLAAADHQRSAGSRLRGQLAVTGEPGQRELRAQHAAARFGDCRSLWPGFEIAPLPTPAESARGDVPLIEPEPVAAPALDADASAAAIDSAPPPRAAPVTTPKAATLKRKRVDLGF